MNSVERQKLLEAVNTLPDESLPELATFIDYLQYKVDQPKPKSGSNFLMSIAGLGASDVEYTSERDEEILQDEIDPIHGWSVKSNQHP
ncbi:hypothetical protein Q2T42_02575 [Leptolyngbya boryana CZ1]|uniref:DUF2281 domain-containing protein n=1 Tax=Leptolyngbya boryana CZ1 TaxID=3060204 RepID=A0AA96WWV0_LEPBY|nr:hypothetical protein [Leptolyngbya boryana]WNZ46723.1 hypothetical protein Q2T42_02575 [Leptolyngbya boryana CZ1]